MKMIKQTLSGMTVTLQILAISLLTAGVPVAAYIMFSPEVAMALVFLGWFILTSYSMGEKYDKANA